MTYCVGMLLNRGIVFMSDTRSNAGIDNISTFCKLHTWSLPGSSALTLLTSGNLATTQAVVSLLDERSKAQDRREPTLLKAESMFQAARVVANTLHEVIDERGNQGPQSEGPFAATLILGGQIKPGPSRLFMIYPEGNFIEAGPDTPFFQIGEMKYGRPILVRAYDPGMSFEDAMKLLLVSFDSTLKANLTVGAPFDFHIYETDRFEIGRTGRIELEDPYFQSVSKGWGDALRSALDSIPAFRFDA
ncbi:hypothetical protein DEA8626_03331 [Defluviimonas aquaemixtae]|uniref:Proteasome subunit beta n=1 Tax=Albidovulum aquaemixtae TaxID=1542388 RepID=A0A2R8BLM3_9RHOB|nr:peptidase [Defluviimonas aquaemixtae]SPH24281.1 hypothetical protein DEA8626_03331 [Defluviimonas aquaemixtae]